MKKVFLLFVAVLSLVTALPVSSFNYQPPRAEAQAVNLYGRSVLANHKKAPSMTALYDQLVWAVDNHDPTLYVEASAGLTYEDLRLVVDLYRRDHSEQFWFSSGSYTTTSWNNGAMKIHFSQHAPKTLATQQAAFDAAVAKAIAGVKREWSDYDKALYLHDYIAKHVTYQKTANDQTAYGALVEGKAVCAGYARAYQVLLHAVGIPSFIALGTSRGIGHAWNYVCLDGVYYQTDVTWDDQYNGDSTYIFYTYFNMSDAQMKIDHTLNKEAFALPTCSSRSAFYFTVNGGYIQNFTSAEQKQVVALMKQALEQGKTTFQLYAPKGSAKLVDWVFDNSYAMANKAGLGDCVTMSGASILGDSALFKLKVSHQYSSSCDAVCNNCSIPRQKVNHRWKNGSCTLCKATSPSKVKITTAPKTTYAKEGGTAKVTVKASDSGLKYQWYIKNAEEKSYKKSVITKATYSTKMGSHAHNRLLYCVITDQYGNRMQTNTVRLRRAASILTQPKTVTVKSGQLAKTTVKAVGDGLKYQWYFKNAGQKAYAKSSITKATYSVKMGSQSRNRSLYCVVTDQYGKTVKTTTVTLKMK